MRPAPADTLAGMLQRGRGRGAMLATTDPTSADLVHDCVVHDYRWDWQVDDRAVYLARLVRDLALPLHPITALLRDTGDDQTALTLASLLVALGTAGSREAVTAVRDHVRAGPHWIDVLETAAAEWPRAWWDDLAGTARRRLTPDDRRGLLWRSDPWLTWARQHAWATRPATDRAPGRPGPHRDRPTGELLALLRDRDVPRAAKTRALFEIARRGPEPALLDLAEHLVLDTPVRRPVPGLGRALQPLGPRAADHARRWSADPDHPLRRIATRVLAAHGDHRDVELMLSTLERPPGEDWCGYDVAATGLARLSRLSGSTADHHAAAHRAVPVLRRLWSDTPHSYERAAYLDALVALSPVSSDHLLVEGLWDCEEQVRAFAAARAPLTRETRARLRDLADDPIDTTPVRTAAAARLA
ncbi:hypothetical protein AB0I91_24210 [Actinosynnema sp. NPDC049800]